MPKPCRESTARADTRPAFNRPPGTRGSPQFVDDEDDDSLRPPKRPHREKAKQSPRGTPERIRRGERRVSSSPVKKSSGRDREKYASGSSTNSGSQLLSADALSKLNAHNEKIEVEEHYQARKRKEKQYKNLKAAEVAQQRRRKKNRNVSGAILEEGRVTEKHRRTKQRGGGRDGEYEKYESRDTKRGSRRKWLIVIGIAAVVLITIIAVAIAVKNKKSSSSTSSTTSDTSSGPSNTCDGSDTPTTAKGTILDVSSWMDTTDFNCTYTAETVGNLSVMGLMSSWDDTTKANSNVPPLNQNWTYGTRPIRGVNLGGWLSIEPFITPSLFNYPSAANVVDEWTLSQQLGNSLQHTIENHYATFITKQTFVDIANAGLDHVRIPYPYWAVTTYSGDPYLPQVAWRYLLRAIEWARQSGIRVNLDLHSVPGSQNGWAHSGHQGSIDWISGTDGALNAQRSLDIHNQLSQFFAQERYKNVVTIYGLVNEPEMLAIPVQSVLDWNQQAISIIRKNGIEQWLSFGDGFLTLTTWDNMFKDVDPKLVMDTHQYQIFNTALLNLTHQNKINLACSGWTGLIVAADNPKTGWGPIMDGEWSQADTDCAQYLNNVGIGSRWAGTLNTGDSSTSILTPTCASSPSCSCSESNADPSTYNSAYKQFLKMFAEGQMHSFEQAWGWFYWTWKTESAPQWSWYDGLQAGILPSPAYSPDFTCNTAVPDFSTLGLPESY